MNDNYKDGFKCEHGIIRSPYTPRLMECSKEGNCAYKFDFGTGKYCKIVLNQSISKGELEKKVENAN